MSKYHCYITNWCSFKRRHFLKVLMTLLTHIDFLIKVSGPDVRHPMTDGYVWIQEFPSPEESENPPHTQIYPQQRQTGVLRPRIKTFTELWNFHANLNSDSIRGVRDQDVVENIYMIYSQLEQYQHLGILRHVSTEWLKILETRPSNFID